MFRKQGVSIVPMVVESREHLMPRAIGFAVFLTSRLQNAHVGGLSQVAGGA